MNDYAFAIIIYFTNKEIERIGKYNKYIYFLPLLCHDHIQLPSVA